ncbi:hypothetical protein VNO80_30479 [Phaseolus coccineus]|uniref:Bifunctional inhibitor/plant lipid transfer protein/seed storage helical domain-containing protein n=1 Tax=Phaseolus coccineus TaxID=3886 RepID=A0AAN9LCV7_PHACN
MGEKKIVALLMFIMAYGLAVTSLSYSEIPATCNGDEKLLSYCGSYLVNIRPNPTHDCCKAASDAFRKAMVNGQGIRDLCNCLRVAGPDLNFQKPKLEALPTACGIKLSFNMELCVYGPLTLPN